MELTNLMLAAVLGVTEAVAAATDTEIPRLAPCPETPNCVSTQASRAEQRMEPIPFRGDLPSARARLVTLLEREPRVSIEEIDEHLVRSVFTTRILRFDDDVVFVLDPMARVIHFRSASRVGRGDLGANRKRMERLTELYLEIEAAEVPES